MALHQIKFETLDAFLTFAQGAATCPESECISRTADNSWAGGTFADAVNMARVGWPEGRNKLASLRDSLTARRTYATLPAEVVDVAGAFPIPALAAAGDPACMVDLQPVEDRRRPIVRLMIQAAYSSIYKAAEVVNFGAALCTLIDGIEAANFRVEVVSSWLSRPGTGRRGVEYAQHVTLKRAEDAAEVDRLAYALTHPSYLRRLCFAVVERQPQLYDGYVNGGSYGAPFPPEAKGWIDDDQILISGLNAASPGSWSSPERALQLLEPIVRKALTEHGVNLPKLWGEDRARA